MNYGKIKPVDVANGEGVRVSLFVSGCPHRCKGCFNSELWDYDAGQRYGNRQLVEVLRQCGNSYISGLSLLGGEPLAPENVYDLIFLCYYFKQRYPNKTIWCYTGYEWKDVKDFPIMRYIDVLVDGRFVQELADPRLRFRGSSNQRIIDVQESLKNRTVVLRKDLME